MREFFDIVSNQPFCNLDRHFYFRWEQITRFSIDNMAVSYTHLDVYKRQVFSQFFSGKPAKDISRQIPSGILPQTSSPFQHLMPSINTQQDTHDPCGCQHSGNDWSTNDQRRRHTQECQHRIDPVQTHLLLFHRTHASFLFVFLHVPFIFSRLANRSVSPSLSRF